MEVNTNNKTILIGSVKQTLDRRIVLGEGVSSEIVVLFNTLNKSLTYCINQYNAGHTEYSSKIQKLENLLHSLKYGCSSICNYYKPLVNSGTIVPVVDVIIDFKASNMNIQIDTTEYRISELQITI